MAQQAVGAKLRGSRVYSSCWIGSVKAAVHRRLAGRIRSRGFNLAAHQVERGLRIWIVIVSPCFLGKVQVLPQPLKVRSGKLARAGESHFSGNLLG